MREKPVVLSDCCISSRYEKERPRLCPSGSTVRVLCYESESVTVDFSKSKMKLRLSYAHYCYNKIKKYLKKKG